MCGKIMNFKGLGADSDGGGEGGTRHSSPLIVVNIHCTYRPIAQKVTHPPCFENRESTTVAHGCNKAGQFVIDLLAMIMVEYIMG